jgi:hypothetical protein
MRMMPADMGAQYRELASRFGIRRHRSGSRHERGPVVVERLGRERPDDLHGGRRRVRVIRES